MSEEERQWVLDNVEIINVDTKDIDEICCGLEHLSIFATETIQNFATNLLKLQQENSQLKERIEKAIEYIEENKLNTNKISEMLCGSEVMTLLEILEGDE